MAQNPGSGANINRDLAPIIRPVIGYLPTNTTATFNGSSVNLRYYEGAMFEIALGLPGDTLAAGTKFWTITFQDSPDNGSGSPSGFSNVLGTQGNPEFNALTDPDGWLTAASNPQSIIVSQNAAGGAAGAWGAQTVFRIGYVGQFQWVRVVVTATGTMSVGTPISISVVKGFPRKAPALA